MRPIKLTLCGFCSYLYEEIQLDQLGSEGLYLICGDTGAGKTTIFDAITYALYGTSSGKIRDASMLRSRSMDASQRPYVNLVFLHSQHEYIVERSLPYHPPRRKTEAAADASVWKDGDLLASGLREVTSVITELLGLTHDQFTQVAMIAQGGFMELLKASSGDRRKIFRRLFSTSIYERLQERVQKDNAAAKNNLDGVVQRMRQCINQTCGAPEDEESLIPFRQSTAPDVQAFLTLLDAMIQRDQAQYKDLRTRFDALTLQIQAARLDVQRGEEQQLRQIELLSSQEKFRILDAGLVQAHNNLISAQKRLPEAEALQQQIFTLSSQLEKYVRRDQCLSALKTLTQTQQRLTQTVASMEQALQSLEKQLQQEEADCTRLSSAPQEVLTIQQEIRTLSQTRDQLDELTRMLKTAGDTRNALNKATETARLAVLASTEQHQRWQQMEKAYFANLLGGLAQELQEGVPCSVCGSTVHPHPAPLSPDCPYTREDVDHAKEVYEQARSKAEQAIQVRERYDASLKEQKEAFMQLAQKILVFDDPGQITPLIKQHQADLQAAQAALQSRLLLAQNNEKAYHALQTLRTGHLSQLERDRIAHRDTSAKLASCMAECKAAEATLQSLSTGLIYASREEADRKIASLTLEQKNIAAAVEEAQKQLDAVNAEKFQLAGQITTLEKQLVAAQPIHMDEVKARLSALDAQAQEQQAGLELLISRIQMNIMQQESLRRLQDEYRIAEQEYSTLLRLHATFSGKLSLEAWVQTSYFDRILHHANQRLRSMTGGQYELLRRQEELDARTQAGLNLDVLDHHNGAVRSAASLSGGESFKAALSLALGLSDEIQVSSGGVKLDTMFVDEGFGSLDEYSLQQAITALSSVSNTGRLVGIISHVGELKHQIERQIVVTKGNDGTSHAKIV